MTKYIVKQVSSGNVGGGVSRQPIAFDMGLRSFKYANLDIVMEEWVSWCEVGKLQANVDASFAVVQNCAI